MSPAEVSTSRRFKVSGAVPKTVSRFLTTLRRDASKFFSRSCMATIACLYLIKSPFSRAISDCGFQGPRGLLLLSVACFRLFLGGDDSQDELLEKFPQRREGVDLDGVLHVGRSLLTRGRGRES